jgi:hypothetical protein
MSTTVYSGCKFRDDDDFTAIIKRFNDARPQALLLADTILEQHIAARALDKLDELIIQAIGGIAADNEDQETFGEILQACFKKTVDRRKNPDTQHHADIDTSASIVVIPHETGLYGVVRCNNNQMLDYMKSTLGFEGYEWWNNTDAPDDISEAQWDARGEVWNKILDKESVVSYLGAEMILVKRDHYVPYLSANDTLDFSGARAFETRVFGGALKLHLDENDVKQTPGSLASRIMELKEGKDPGFEALRAKIARILPSSLEPHFFRQNLKDILGQAKAEWDADTLDKNAVPALGTRSGSRM